ncbi:M48 family metallopeptidase [uncultured Lacinutrix sp.]|uniref:M48 family metallopeptidase n=1 Tax=uncultured Lacinutrix sp. TaxID=574032 RepID=UPI00260DCA66|nr:M48 family metallopeptidase [uncultured Lacinutrix sp.]
MLKDNIKVSEKFKSQTGKAMFAITVFIIVYIVIFILSLVLTVACVYGGITLIITKPSLITIVLGIGIASLGILVFIFLIKFIFKSNKTNLSHLVEITEKEEPLFFKMIRGITNEVGTPFPKKIYFSPDVNASVFYDSSFWSMFLPIKKNLQVGMGLINTITEEELKAILSHEFGHFSQRTMKVGSIVYNLNQIIYNTIHDNESFDKLIVGWANLSGYLSIFVMLALKIIQAIQYILKIMYEFVNKNYLALSREMEFHADEIAANVTGYLPLKTSLLRMNLADHAFNSVIGFYENKIAENIKSNNIYTEQKFVIQFISEYDDLHVVNNFPQITIEDLNKLNKSKLTIENQWASHPSIEERIVKLEATMLVHEEKPITPATNLLTDVVKTQKELTSKVFGEIKYSNKVLINSLESFKSGYKEDFEKKSFAKKYNGYYDNKNPQEFVFNEQEKLIGQLSFSDLFSDKQVHLCYEELALISDIEILKQIDDKTIKIKTFDYDGIKYKRKETKTLLKKLKGELEELKEVIKTNDINIYNHFKIKEQKKDKNGKLKKMYIKLFDFEKDYDKKMELYETLINKLQFINFTTPFEEIKSNFLDINFFEKKLKKSINEFLRNDEFIKGISKEMKGNFELYLSKDWEYFGNQNYFDKNLELLFTTLNNYVFLLSNSYFTIKKDLLDYKLSLIE